MDNRCLHVLVKVLYSFLLFSLFLFLIVIDVSHPVEIRRISVPRWIQNGTEQFVVLDCDYSYNENDLQLVVKWFFQGNPEPVYQWIPELNKRHVSALLKNNLDLNFTVNTVDMYSRYRALKILKPSTQLSGKYTCLVTSLAGQDSREQVMTVFVPAKEFELAYIPSSNESIKVTCEAHDIFPAPLMKLYIGTVVDSTRDLMTYVHSDLQLKFNGAYDAYLHRTFSASELLMYEHSLVITCSLELPGTNFSKTKTITYFSGKPGLQIGVAHSISAVEKKFPSCFLMFGILTITWFIYCIMEHKKL